MDAGDLLLLDSIIVEGGVTAAARKLGQPKATISRRLKRLESAAGAPVFDRASRRLRLTPFGESLAAHAAAVRVAVAGALTSAQANRKGEGGCLRLSAPFLFGRLVLAPFVGKFLAAHPAAKAAIRFSNEIVDPLRDGYDIAIQIPEPKQTYLIRSRLAAVPLKLYAVPALARSIASVTDLRSHGLINTAPAHAESSILRLTDGRRAHELTLEVVCTVNDPEAACLIAASGCGVAALPEFLARNLVDEGRLQPVLPRHTAGGVGIYAALPPGRLTLPLVRDFLAALKKELKAMRFAK